MHAPNHHRPLDGQTRLLTKIARLYHERNVRQADIAAALNISQAKVSRLLKRAAEVGIVRTIVTIPPAVYTDLEEQLETTFGLADAIVVDVAPDADEGELLSALGAGTAAYLESVLAGPDRIGISSWSQTLLSVVDRMRPFPAPGAKEIVQLLGGIGAAEMQGHAHRLVGDLASILRADAIYVQAPGVVANKQIRDALLADPSLTDVTEHWGQLTMTLMGIGTIEPSDILAESGNAFAAEDRATLLADGAVGDICHRVFRSDGSSILGDIDDRIIAIPTETLLAVPRRIGVAGGPNKVEAIRGALAGSWVNALITDLNTAQQLLQP